MERVQQRLLQVLGLRSEGEGMDTVAARLLPGGLSENSRKTLESEANKPGGEPTRVVGLVLGSPEFQRR